MRFPRRAKIFGGQLDTAPLVGVLFLLMIFLLFNSSLVFTPGIPIRLPVAEEPVLPGTSRPTAMVVMDMQGLLYFENQVIQEHDLRIRLRDLARKNPGVSLVIQADKAVKLEAFLRLSKLAGEVGIQEVLLAARPPLRPMSMPRLSLP